MKFLVTGAAGFIAFHVIKRLLDEGYQVVGIDNMNDFYDTNLKKSRLKFIKKKFTFYKIDIVDKYRIRKLFLNEKFDRVIHLAAQASVRFSLKNPYIYIDNNILGYLNILEECRKNQVQHLLYASSSSVYGLQDKSTQLNNNSINFPISLYATTKRTNELMSHVYSHLYNIPTTGLRLFTVYGPWGRPDMALFKFTRAIIKGTRINLYNYGNMRRDFTYIDDVVEAIFRLQNIIPQIQIGSSVPYRIYDIGSNTSIKLVEYVGVLESILGKQAKKNMIPIQPGEVESTLANTKDLYEATGFKPNISIKEGIKNFVIWYKNFYNL